MIHKYCEVQHVNLEKMLLGKKSLAEKLGKLTCNPSRKIEFCSEKVMEKSGNLVVENCSDYDSGYFKKDAGDPNSSPDPLGPIL